MAEPTKNHRTQKAISISSTLAFGAVNALATSGLSLSRANPASADKLAGRRQHRRLVGSNSIALFVGYSQPAHLLALDLFTLNG